MKSEEKNILRMKVQQLMIDTVAVKEGLRLCQRCFDGALNCGDSRDLLIIGESGTGKTRLLRHFSADFNQSRTSDGLKIPIIFGSVPSKPTVKGLAMELLYQINDPNLDKCRTEQKLTNGLKKLIYETGVRIIMLDEFQHFVDQGSLKVQHHVADWLKMIAEDTGVNLVVAGLPRCKEVIEHNSQLGRRFQAPLLMPTYDWSNEDDVTEFYLILKTIQEELLPFEFMQLDSDEMAYRIYAATGGIMGRLLNLLTEATSSALEENKLQITYDDMYIASLNASYDIPGDIGMPFSKDFPIPSTEVSQKIHRFLAE